MMPLLLLRASFEQRLANALGEAARAGEGFYLGGFAARRALGAGLSMETDPRRIERRLRHRILQNGRTRVIRDRFLGAGDWSSLLDPLYESSTHREVRDVARAGLDYRRTFMYGIALERAAGPKPIKRNFVALKTPELVEAYFQGIADLIRSIERDGVVRRSEYRRLSHFFSDSGVRRPWTEAVEADIGVAVGANGEIFRFGPGKHRTAVAQELGLTSIPVEVRMVHAAWLRRQIAESGHSPREALLHGIRSLDGGAAPVSA